MRGTILGAEAILPCVSLFLYPLPVTHLQPLQRLWFSHSPSVVAGVTISNWAAPGSTLAADVLVNTAGR